MHIFSAIAQGKWPESLTSTHKMYMKWFITEHNNYIPSKTHKYPTQQHLTSGQTLNTNKINNSFEMETNTLKLVKP